VAERLRQFSRIIEPDAAIDPYRHWGARISWLDRELTAISDLLDPKEIAERLDRLLSPDPEMPLPVQEEEPQPNLAYTRRRRRRQYAPAPRGIPPRKPYPLTTRVHILHTALNLAYVVSEEFTRGKLQQSQEAYDAIINQSGGNNDDGAWLLLKRMLSAADFFAQTDAMHFVATRLECLLTADTQVARKEVYAKFLAEPCLRLLCKYQLSTEVERLCHALSQSVGSDSFTVLLPVAAAFSYLGQAARAEPIIEEARAILFDPKTDPGTRYPLARLYAPAAVQGTLGRQRLEELITILPNVRCFYATGPYYARSHLEVIEAVVLTVLERNQPIPLRVGCDRASSGERGHHDGGQ
jgi:hypothetical protein